MKLAIISDIHGNLPALSRVLEAIQATDCQKVICLGDVVGYGACPNECIELLESRSIPCILGNHDAAAIGKLDTATMNRFAREAIEWTSKTLSDRSYKFLRQLDLKITLDDALFVHASPDRPNEWRYLFNFSDAVPSFQAFSESICFFGHTHYPVVFTEPKSNRRLINVGSVGQPRDRDPRACYGLYDTTSGSFRWERVAYSVEEAATQIIAADLPSYLAERLSIGA